MHISPNMRFTLSIWIYEILESFKISLGCVVPEKPQNLTFWNLVRDCLKATNKIFPKLWMSCHPVRTSAQNGEFWVPSAPHTIPDLTVSVPKISHFLATVLTG